MDRRKALKVIGLGTAALAVGVPPAAPAPPVPPVDGWAVRERFMPGCIRGRSTRAHVTVVAAAGWPDPLYRFLPRYTLCVDVPPGMDLTPGTHLRMQDGLVPGRSPLMRIEAVRWGEVPRKNGKSTLAAPPIELHHLRRAWVSLRTAR